MLTTAPRTLAIIVSSILAASSLAGPAPAQTVGGQVEKLWQFDGQARHTSLGSSVSGAGDVDGDGFDDVIVGASNADPGGLSGAGSAFAYSGATGSLLWQFDGQASVDFFGGSVSGAGDVDGDGFDDVIVGAYAADAGGLTDAGSAYVYSGANGSLLWQFDGQASYHYLGSAVSGAGDVDGDGFDDVIVGAHGADHGGLSDAGSAYVYSGATGSLIWQFDGQALYAHLGASVSDAGDVDMDGFDDVIAGAPYADVGGLSFAGSAYVYSGMDGHLIWQFDGQAMDDSLGWSASGAGDVDGDGTNDMIFGVYQADPGGMNSAGSAYVYSGATGSLLWQFDGQASDDYLGFSVSGAGDVDGDGFDDVIVGAHQADYGGLSQAGSALVYSGANGSLLRQFNGQAEFDRMGFSVSGTGDMDGDGLGDVIAGAYWADPGGLSRAGSAFVYSLDPFLHTAADTISYSGAQPAQLSLSFPLSEAGMPYAVLFSLEGIGPSVFQGLDIPLTQDGHFQMLLGNPNLRGTLDASAEALLNLPMHQRTPPGAIGRTMHLAAVTLDPGTWTGRMSSVVRYVEVVP